MCSKVSIFLFILAELACSMSQIEIKEETNSESTSAAIPKKEINTEDLYKKIEDLILVVEENHKKAKNVIRNSIIPVKEELNSMISDLKLDMNNKINNITSEIEKVRLEMNNFNSNITSENKMILNELSELKTFKALSEIYTINIANELNKTNNILEMNINEFFGYKTVIDELKQFKVGSDNIMTEVSEIDNKCENNINKLAELQKVINELKKVKFYPRNCADLFNNGDEHSGVKKVYPFNHSPGRSISVVCDQVTEGGSWTVFQNRDYQVYRQDFYQNWYNYSKGFGDLNGEFWMGLENLHIMSKYTQMELRVDLEDEVGVKRFAKYDKFSIGSSRAKFRLNIGKYSGDAGDSLTFHNGKRFSTFDQNNNDHAKEFGNCALRHMGAWWYSTCYRSNLNGFQFVGEYASDPPIQEHGITWSTFRGFTNSLRKSKMMFRPQ